MSPREQLYQLMADLFAIDASELSPASSRESIDRWDSMGTIDLVAQLEKTFSVRFDLLEVDQLLTLEIVEKSLVEKGVQF
jgi:acyl carrier protein